MARYITILDFKMILKFFKYHWAEKDRAVPRGGETEIIALAYI